MSAKLSILIIEDEKNIGNYIETIVISNGYKALRAMNGMSGLSLCTSHHPDLILLDLMLPDISGYTVLKEIRKISEVPVIILSARSAVADQMSGFEKGADDYITKPFSMEELINTVAQAIGEKDRKEYAPDFSLILSGEDNREEMLALFIEESRKDLAALTAALDRQDKEAAASILHKNLPLWETVRLDFPLQNHRCKSVLLT